VIRRHRLVWLSILITSTLFLGALARGAVAQGEDGAGLAVSGQATAKDVGLPIYPGAKPYRDTGDDSDAARLALWGGGSGFKLAVLRMESKDAPARVADFYRKALTKYGKVLDCGNDVASDAEKNGSGALSCGNDKPDQDGLLFKREQNRSSTLSPSSPMEKEPRSR
jgi:hypothetical protein